MFKLNDFVRKCSVDGEMVLLDSRGGFYFGLNEVGSRMLELALKSENREAVIRSILKEFDAEEKVIRKDFSELLDALKAKGMIVEHED